MPRMPLRTAAAMLAPVQEKKGLEIHWVDVEGGAATLTVAPSGKSYTVAIPGKGTKKTYSCR